MKRETLLRLPLIKTILFAFEMIRRNEKFWKAVVISRLLSLKSRGVSYEAFEKMVENFGREPLSKVAVKYAPMYFIKSVVDDLLPGIILTGIFDLVYSLPMKTFVFTLFSFTFLFAFLDMLSFVKIESTALKHREDILRISKEAFKSDRIPGFDEIYKELV